MGDDARGGFRVPSLDGLGYNRLSTPPHEDTVVPIAEVSPPPVPRQPQSAWPLVAKAMHAHLHGLLATAQRGASLRTRVEIVADPHDVQGDSRSEVASRGILVEGDARLARIQWLLDNFGVQRTICQRLWHWHMICACLPHIYGARDWARVSFRVLQNMGLRTLKQEVLIQTFRRAGKTECLAQLFAALLLNVPGIKIAIISTGDRASGKLKKITMGYISRVKGAMRRVCGLTHEFIYIAAKELPPNVHYRSPAAITMQYDRDTSTLEAMPNNPNGEGCIRGCLSITDRLSIFIHTTINSRVERDAMPRYVVPVALLYGGAVRDCARSTARSSHAEQHDHRPRDARRVVVHGATNQPPVLACAPRTQQSLYGVHGGGARSSIRTSPCSSRRRHGRQHRAVDF